MLFDERAEGLRAVGWNHKYTDPGKSNAGTRVAHAEVLNLGLKLAFHLPTRTLCMPASWPGILALLLP